MIRTELENICREWVKLKTQWEKTSKLWNDKEKIYFESEFWIEFEHQIPHSIKGLEKTTDSISKICEKLGLKIF